MILLALAKNEGIRGHSSINTQRTAIIFIRLLPSTTLLSRGETLFHLPPINILEIFKDFPSTIRKYSKTFSRAELSEPRIISTRKYSKTFSPVELSQPQITNIPEIFKEFPSSSNQQQQPATATSNSNQPQHPAAATSRSNQKQQPTTAISSSNQQQRSTFILPATPTQSSPTSVSYHYGS